MFLVFNVVIAVVSGANVCRIFVRVTHDNTHGFNMGVGLRAFGVNVFLMVNELYELHVSMEFDHR